MADYRKRGLSPEMIKALDELDEARREWQQLLAEHPVLQRELQERQRSLAA